MWFVAGLVAGASLSLVIYSLIVAGALQDEERRRRPRRIK